MSVLCHDPTLQYLDWGPVKLIKPASDVVYDCFVISKDKPLMEMTYF